MCHSFLSATREGILAQCKLCERSGWLLQVDGLGLCANCSVVAGQQINDHTRILLESLRIIESSQSYSTIFSRIGVAARSCDALAPYADKGVLSLNRHPKEVRRDIEDTFGRCVRQAIDLSVNTGREKAALLHKSAEGRSSPFPGQAYPATSVTGVPRAVKPFRTAIRTWNSAT
jgi:hypothetical protein